LGNCSPLTSGVPPAGTTSTGRFIHHGYTIDQLETIRAFMLDAWVLFLELAKASRKFDTKEQLTDHLEAMRLS
jgi:hypothetical protein